MNKETVAVGIAYGTAKNNAPAETDHNEAMVAMLRENPEFAELYLQIAFEEIYEPGGVSAFLVVLRQVIEARGGIAAIAEKSGINRKHVYRVLSGKGNPTIRTLTELTRAADVRLTAMHSA
jgi:probable addiction module antidote protein